MAAAPPENSKAGQEPGTEHALHISVSNQSLALPIATLAVRIDGREVFGRELTTGTQHTWERVTVPVAAGLHLLLVDETQTETHQSMEVNVTQELWIGITFHGPPARAVMRVFDHPIATM